MSVYITFAASTVYWSDRSACVRTT